MQNPEQDNFEQAALDFNNLVQGNSDVPPTVANLRHALTALRECYARWAVHQMRIENSPQD